MMDHELFDEAAFIAQARELLRSESLNRALLDSLPFPAMLIHKNRRIVSANKAAEEIGVEVASFCWDTFGKKASISQADKNYYEKNKTVPPKGIHCTFCRADDALISQRPIFMK